MLIVTGTQVLAHLVGDFVLQSDELANAKTTQTRAALWHVAIYGLAFWLIMGASWKAMAFVIGSHFVIDRWRLARHVGWAKNWLGPSGIWWLATRENISRPKPWAECSKTGYDSEKSVWMAVWLMIIVDQVLHIACNAIAMQVWPRR